MQQSCFYFVLYSSNHPCSELLIITHHIQNSSRNNNWSSIYQHIQWNEFQWGIWYKMFQMHLIFSIFTFSGSKLVHCISIEVLHISWKFYFKIFHNGWFIEKQQFSGILPMSDDSNKWKCPKMLFNSPKKLFFYSWDNPIFIFAPLLFQLSQIQSKIQQM